MAKLIKILYIIIFVSIGTSQEDIPTTINSVNLIGVETYNEKQIRNILRIHDATLLSKMDYDRRLIKLDDINIKTFYVSKGFLGVIVKDSVAISDNIVDVYFIVNEGKQYYIRSLIITGNLLLSSNKILI